MKGPIKTTYFFLVLIFSTFLLSSCEDPELDALMDDYCECISNSVHHHDKRINCIEKMDSIKEKYKNDSYKLGKVIEKTNMCHN